MKTTELIKLLKDLEFGASGRPREISFTVEREGEREYLGEMEVVVDSSGDGIAGAELGLALIKQ